MAEWRNGGMAEWWNGGMAEWQNGGMAEWRNGGMVEWQSGRMAEWQNGGMAEWHNVRYKIEWNQDRESTKMPPWRSPSWLVQGKVSLVELPLGFNLARRPLQIENAFISSYVTSLDLVW
jgi:hypothetical protein